MCKKKIIKNHFFYLIHNYIRFYLSLQLLNYDDSTVGQRPQWATMTSPYVSFEAKVLDKNQRNISPTRNNVNSTHTFSPIKSGSRPVTARSERDPPSKLFFFINMLTIHKHFTKTDISKKKFFDIYKSNRIDIHSTNVLLYCRHQNFLIDCFYLV